MTLTQAKEKLLATARAELRYKEGYNNYIKYETCVLAYIYNL